MVKVMSERQRYWHGHLQRAAEQQVSLAQYGREQGLKLTQLYGAKTWLQKLGVWPRGAPRAAAPASEFVAVRMLPPGSGGVRCRLSHVSGWSLECDHWPEAAWLRRVVADAAA